MTETSRLFDDLRASYGDYLRIIDLCLLTHRDLSESPAYGLIDAATDDLRQKLDSFIEAEPGKRLLRLSLRQFTAIPHIVLILLDYYLTLPLSNKDRKAIAKSMAANPVFSRADDYDGNLAHQAKLIRIKI